MTRNEKIVLLLENFKRDVLEFRPDWSEETYKEEKESLVRWLNTESDNQLDLLIELDGPVFFTSPGKSIIEELVENYGK